MQAGGDGERPRGMDGHAERAVQYHPPVTEFVVEAFHHEGFVIRDLSGGGFLLVQVAEKVVGGPLVKAGGFAACQGLLAWCCTQFPDERTQCPAQLHRAAQGIPLPEREFSGLAKGGGDQHPVKGDVFNFPARGTEGEHVSHAGFVHHLLIEFAHAAPALGGLSGDVVWWAHAGEGPGPSLRGLGAGGDNENAKEPAVRNGPTRRDGQTLGPGASCDGPCCPIPNDAGAQFGELVRGVAACQQVQGGLERGAWQRQKRCAAPHCFKPHINIQWLQCRGSHRLLGQDVQRVGGDGQRFDLPCQHPLHRDGRMQQVGTMLGEKDPL